MPSILTCPDDAELLAAAGGEQLSAELQEHLAQCPRCPERVNRYRGEMAALRECVPDLASSPSPASDRTDEQTPPNGHADDIGPTTDLGFDCDAGTVDDPPIPATIGKYLVVGRFPGSGQAEVFRVVHPELRQERVIKLAKDRVGVNGRSDIIEEGRILAALDHPNVVRVYELDFYEDRPYLVMEYVRGRSLKDYASEHPLTPRKAAALLAKVCGAAEAAHRRGIVHRDIKHLNILIDDKNEPRLIDFGMARSRTFWSEDPTRAGGTFAFMAPEQARVESSKDQQRVGPRSDVFALGGVLYYLLTAKAPFGAETWRGSWDRARRCDIDYKALEAPKIPRELRRICLKAMAADPQERFTSAAALQIALERYVRAPVVWSAVAMVACLTLLGGLAYGLLPARSAGPAMISAAKSTRSLTGELIVRVWSKNNERKHGLKIDEPGALPLLPGELVHLEAKLNQPAYPYLLWLDGQGHVVVLYPRQDNKFGGSATEEHARETLHSPEAIDGGHRMKGPGGLETALLLVRNRPLPSNVDLAAAIGPLPPTPLRSELEVAVWGGDEGEPVEMLSVALHRGIDENQTEKIDDPLLQLMERLRTQTQFAVIKAVRFAYRGE
jgi:predicted Ser/Thr protein kinase